MIRRHLPSARARGLSMVELMVALTIGLILSVVIANLFVGTKASYRAQDDLSRVQENLRYATHVLSRAVRSAGYRADWNQSFDQVFGVGVPVVEGQDEASAHGDVLIVRFQGGGAGTSPAGCAATNSCTGADGTVVDCLGNRIDRAMGAARFAENRFQVRSPGANGGPALFCSIDGGNTWTEIVPDIEALQVLFGEKVSPQPNIERLLPPGTGGQNLANVIAIRFALVHRSATPSAGLVDTRTYDLLGATYDPPDDRRFRLATATTVLIRNRSQ